jgi:hypothetical protein
MKSPTPNTRKQTSKDVLSPVPSSTRSSVAVDDAYCEAVHTLVEIYNSGYQGIQLNLAIQPDGFLHVCHTDDPTTPEGSIAKFVTAFAEYGYLFAAEDVMNLLTRVYHAEGLPIPTPLPVNAQINLHGIREQK